MRRSGRTTLTNPSSIGDADELREALARDPDLRDLAECIAKIVDAVERIWGTPHHPWFTDHGPDHSRRVASYALRLALLPRLHETNRLSVLETFILWSAAWLHDIGMQDLRASGKPIGEMDPDAYSRVRHLHPDRSSYNILHDWAQLGLPQGDVPLAETVAAVARAHGTKFYKETISERLQPVERVRNHEVRPRLLAALLLFADELDLHYQRATPPSGWADYNVISEAHSFKHKCVQAVTPICEPDGRIAVQLELAFPDELSEENRQITRRWIEGKLLKQMGLIEPEIIAGFASQARFDRVIRTSVRTSMAHIPTPSDAALAVIRADTVRDELINHENNYQLAKHEIDSNGIVVVLPRQPTQVPPQDDGQADLVEAVAAAVEAAGRKVCISRQAALVLGATAADVIREWIRCMQSESAVQPQILEQGAVQELDRLISMISAKEGEKRYLFAIVGGEYMEAQDLSWLAAYALPRLREACPETAFALTSGSDWNVVVPATAALAISMSDLSKDDIAEYLRRFVVEEVAQAEGQTHDSYTQVKLQGQQHLVAQRRRG